jgi:hypothetical protein
LGRCKLTWRHFEREGHGHQSIGHEKGIAEAG